MSESDALLTVDTDTGPERVRVIIDGAEDKPAEHWWPVSISTDPDGTEWESFA